MDKINIDDLYEKIMTEPKMTSIKKSTDPLDRFTYDHFVDKIDKDIVFCAVCTAIIKSPVELGPCGHLFCKQCVNTLLQTSVKCPICQGQITQKNESKAFTKMIQSLRIKCCNEKCDKQFTVADITNHLLKECLYEETPCKLCKKNIVRHDMQKHVTECMTFPVECKNCKLFFPRGDNHDFNCPNALISCIYQDILGCGVLKKRKEILEHENDVAFHFHLSLTKLQNKMPIVESIYIDVLDINPRNTLSTYKVDEATDPATIEQDLVSSRWEPALVVDYKDDKIRVHYLGWSESYDEYINVKKNKYRIAPLRSHSYALLSKKHEANQMYETLFAIMGIA